jgi:hypothetical protein
MPMLYVRALAAAGILYAIFQGSAVTDLGFGDDLWQIGLGLHAVILLLAMAGMIGIGFAWQMSAWTGVTWWVATVLAFLGLVVAHLFWALALLGIAGVLWIRFRAALAAVFTAAGGVGWLMVYLLGGRVGNEDARVLTSTETIIALFALACIGAGLVAAAAAISRDAHHEDAGRSLA